MNRLKGEANSRNPSILLFFIFLYMLRKIGIVFLLFLYFFSQTGIRFQIHSCFGRIRSISLGMKKNCPCSPRNLELKSKSCCSTQAIHFTTQESYSKNPIRSLAPLVFLMDKTEGINLPSFSNRLIRILEAYCPYPNAHWGPPIYTRLHSYRV